MNMRHNELLKNENGDFVFRSNTKIGRYSQWFDHSDINFKDVFKKNEFEFQPLKIVFLVPLFKKDLYFVRTENKAGIYSEQFIFCSFPESFKSLNFVNWFLKLIKEILLHSVTLWTIFILNLFRINFVSTQAVLVPIVLFFIFRKISRSYLIQKIIFTELIIWILLLSSFYCVQS